MNIQTEINRYLDCNIPIPLNLQLSHYKEVIKYCEEKGVSIPSGAYKKQLLKKKLYRMNLLYIIIFSIIFIPVPLIINLNLLNYTIDFIIMNTMTILAINYFNKKDIKIDELVYNEFQPNINW